MTNLFGEIGDEDVESTYMEPNPDTDFLYGNCATCGWIGSYCCSSGDPQELAITREELDSQHKELNPGCTGVLSFRRG